MRTIIYARFSGNLQNPRSIEDQITICRERADQERWEIIDVYTDYAIRGAAGLSEAQRPGMGSMLARVAAGGIDQVLVEDTDRIVRHQGDSFNFYEQLRFHGTRLFTLSVGVIDEISATFRGLMDAQFSKNLGAKIKRGQRGTVSHGRSPAGLAYGYRTANEIDAQGRHIRGKREINEDQAVVVQRIYHEFGTLGLSARTIASRLNKEEIPGPRGSHWRASTINGDARRGNGILYNELYVGQLVFNRTSKIVEPTTRTTRIRVNPPEDHLREAVPHLRIMDDAAWEAVKRRQNSVLGVKPGRAVRPKRMLSGLGRCGVCGEGWIVIGTDRWGCTKHRSDGSCTNNRQITTARFEERVLSGFREHLLRPKLVDLFVQEYKEDYARRVANHSRDVGKLRRREAAADAKVQRLVSAIADGGREFKAVQQALAAATADLEATREALNEQEGLPMVVLHPQIAADYRAQVERLSEAILDPSATDTAVPALRRLIGCIIVRPAKTGRGVDIKVQGRLAAIIQMAGGQPKPDERLFVMERVKGIEPSS